MPDELTREEADELRPLLLEDSDRYEWSYIDDRLKRLMGWWVQAARRRVTVEGERLVGHRYGTIELPNGWSMAFEPRFGATPGVGTADQFVGDILADPTSDAFRRLKEWHEPTDGTAPKSLAAMASLLYPWGNTAGSLFDRLGKTPGGADILRVMILLSEADQSAIRDATLAKIKLVESGTEATTLQTTPDGDPAVSRKYFIPVMCTIRTFDAGTSGKVVGGVDYVTLAVK